MGDGEPRFNRGGRGYIYATIPKLADKPEFHYAQYLAVSPLPHIETRPALGEKWPRDTTACIQIWSITPPNIASDGKVIEESRMKCEMVLCVKGGSAMDLKWMPLGAWDEVGRISLSCGAYGWDPAADC